jgi:hypothetical protein
MARRDAVGLRAIPIRIVRQIEEGPDLRDFEPQPSSVPDEIQPLETVRPIDPIVSVTSTGLLQQPNSFVITDSLPGKVADPEPCCHPNLRSSPLTL